jgi:hypothetical protein
MNSPLQALRRSWVRQAASRGFKMLQARDFVKDKIASCRVTSGRLDSQFDSFCEEWIRYQELTSLKRRVDMCDEMSQNEVFVALGWAVEGSYIERYESWNQAASLQRIKVAIKDMQEFCIPLPRRYQ